MIQEYQLRVLPEVAANEQRLKEYLIHEKGLNAREITAAGLICVHYRNELFPQKDKGVLCILKSFFLPLFFIRDYGLGIIRPSKVRLNAPGKMQ